MSILLDSLRKSEAQRKHRDAPTIHSAQEYAAAKPPQTQWFAVVMIVVTAVAIGWFGWKQYAGAGIEDSISQNPGGQNPAVPQSAPQQGLADAGDEAAQPGNQATRTPVERLSQQQEQAKQERAQQSADPGDDVSTQPEDITPADRIAAFSAEEASPPVTDEGASVAFEEDLEGEEFLDDDEEMVLDDEAVREMAEVAPPSSAERRDDAEAFGSEPRSYWQLPQAWRSELPEFKITVLVFAEAPEDRFLLMNGERLQEGDQVDGGVVLEEIRRDGAVFTFRSQRFLVKS